MIKMLLISGYTMISMGNHFSSIIGVLQLCMSQKETQVHSAIFNDILIETMGSFKKYFKLLNIQF
jgi:hypothetical protein